MKIALLALPALAAFSFAPPALADLCRGDWRPRACATHDGGAQEVERASKAFQKSCRPLPKLIDSRASLANSCEQIPTDLEGLRKCAEGWLQNMRGFRNQLSALEAERKIVDQSIEIVSQAENCQKEALENRAMLGDIKARFDALTKTAQEGTEDGKVHSERLHKAYGMALLPTGENDKDKLYIGFKGLPGKVPPTTEAVSASGLVDFVTVYNMPAEANFPGPKDAVIQVDKVQVKVSAAFAKKLLLEGTGLLEDGRLVNARRKGVYMFVDREKAPFGLGALKKTPLEPYRSIAVDKTVIPLGSIVYIHEARGMPLPPAEDGGALYHDGYFLAIDVGSMINGTHIDVYAGPRNEDYRALRAWFYKKSVHYYVVK